MNIDDVSEVGEIPDDIWTEIFNHQRALEIKYNPIESRNGFWVPFDIAFEAQCNLDDPQLQNWIKNKFWRVTEELAEAIEEYPHYPGWKTRWNTDHVVRHHFEELADALHFFVAVSLVIGVNPAAIDRQWEAIAVPMNSLKPNEETVDQQMMHFIRAIGLVANCLKNKPWKSTHMPTDINKVHLKMSEAWYQFIVLWKLVGCGPADIYSLYMKKNSVNQFRQNSHY